MPDSPLNFFISGAHVAWMNKANCADTTEPVKRLFHADELAKRRGLPAEVPPEVDALCQACVIRVECQAWALEHDEHGVWGGTTRQQREAMKRPIVRAKCPTCQGRSLFRAGLQQVCADCGNSWAATKVHGDATAAVEIPVDAVPVALHTGGNVVRLLPHRSFEQPELFDSAGFVVVCDKRKRPRRGQPVRRRRLHLVEQSPIPGLSSVTPIRSRQVRTSPVAPLRAA
jgi:hypothetical protein